LRAWVSLVAALYMTALAVPAYAQPKPSAPASGAPGASQGGAAPAPAGQPQDLVAKGQQLFDDQQYEESIQTLSAALLSPSNTKEQKVEIYRLLALNYITLGRKDEAESAVRGLLVIKPDYALPASESPRFRDFFAEARKKWEDEGRPGLVKAAPVEKPIVLKHAAPSSVGEGESVDIAGRVEDPDGRVASISIFYRSGSKDDFTEAEVDRDGDGFRVQIPGSVAKAPLLEYYLAARDAKGETIATRGDPQSPLRVAVTAPSKGWVLPVAIGGGILGAAAIVGGLALAGVFKGSSGGGGGNGGRGTSTVSISVGEAGFRFR
jgi:tetratricopeptide (TPR) repeat protein